MSGIDTQILKSETIDLSGEDIHRITDGKSRIISYDDLQHINTIDELLGEHRAVIILYQTTKNYGHWVSLMRDGDTLEFFDPYGFEVDEELEVIERLHLRKDGVKVNPHLTVLINQTNLKLKVNKERLQKFSKDVNTCGRWVALRVRLREMSMEMFVAKMTKNKHYSGDFWVSALTILV